MVYLDEDLPNHPKIHRAGVQLGPSGSALVFALHVSAIAYARKFLTDGFIPIEFCVQNTLVPHALEVAKVMASRKVKLFIPCRGGYRIKDFHDWNKKASEIREKRASDRARKQRSRARRSAHVTDGVTSVSQRDVREVSHVDSARNPEVTSHQSPVTSTSVQPGGTDQPASSIVSESKAAAAPPRVFHSPVENQKRVRRPKRLERPTPNQLAKLAHTVIDGHPDDQFAEWKALMKDECGHLGWLYDGETVGGALESALAQREQTRRQRPS